MAMTCWQDDTASLRCRAEHRLPIVAGPGSERSPAGLVLLSPYLRLRHRLAPFAGWLRFLRPLPAAPLVDSVAQHYYHCRPLAGVHQINRLLRALTPRLGAIRLPVLAIHGEGDQTIDIDSGRNWSSAGEHSAGL